jgi:hypothetical protein
MYHDIFKIEGEKINSEKIFTQIDLNEYNNLVNTYYNEIVDEFKKTNDINIIIDDDFIWENECGDWNIYLINSIFISNNSYKSEEEYLEWVKKYFSGYVLILLSSTACWNNSATKRLYFDGFDVDRLSNINVLTQNWCIISNLFGLFNLKHFINKSNVDILKTKWNLIRIFIQKILSLNLIKNDFDLYMLVFILSASIQNNFTLKLNTFECIDYNFTKIPNTFIKKLYVHEITETTENDIKYNKKKVQIGITSKYANLFHINYGYIGQLIRIIGSRDINIKPRTLLLFRDGHATAPSIYEKINMKHFLKSDKLYKIGTSSLYASNWHKLGLTTYRKGILMGYLTFKKINNDVCLPDYIWDKSWGKAFSIRKNTIEAITERIDNIKLGLYNKIDTNIEALDMPFAYGMDEFLATYLAYDINGFTKQFSSDEFINNISPKIEWAYLGWFLNITRQLWNVYPYVAIASKYIFCKFYDIMKDMNVLEFYFICDRIIKIKTYIQNDYITQALTILPSIFNIIQYIALNSCNDDVANIYLKDMFDADTSQKREEYINTIESKKDNCDFYKSINHGVLRKLIYKQNDTLDSDCNLYNLGYGWQDKIFRSSSDYFDPLQRIYEVNIDSKKIDHNVVDQKEKYFKNESLLNDKSLLNNLYNVVSNDQSIFDYDTKNKILSNIREKQIEITNKLNENNQNNQNNRNNQNDLNMLMSIINNNKNIKELLTSSDIIKNVSDLINQNIESYYANNEYNINSDMKSDKNSNFKNINIKTIINNLNERIKIFNDNYEIKKTMEGGYYEKYMKYKNKYLKLKQLNQ